MQDVVGPTQLLLEENPTDGIEAGPKDCRTFKIEQQDRQLVQAADPAVRSADPAGDGRADAPRLVSPGLS
jgi:hypothetical protein